MAKDSPDEVVFAMAGSTVGAAERISLTDAGLREREHLQKWVIVHPEIIGPDVMIVTFEFDHWSSATLRATDLLNHQSKSCSGSALRPELETGCSG